MTMVPSGAFRGAGKLFNKAWLAACVVMIVITLSSNVVVYMQVSRNLTEQIKRGLIWEAKLYREQLEQTFYRAALYLDSVVHSSAAKAEQQDALQEELHEMHRSDPSIIRSWVAYPSGTIIPANNTRLDYVLAQDWWQPYLGGEAQQHISYPLGRSQAMAGQPYRDDTGLTTIIPLVRFALQDTRIIRLGALELNVSDALIERSTIHEGWAENPVSIYDANGRLLASPYRHLKREHEYAAGHTSHPLLEILLQNPGQEDGFTYFNRNGQRMAGVFVRVPTIGIILTVERSAEEVAQPLRYITTASLIIVLLSTLIASLLSYTLYTSYQKLRIAEQLTLSAEFHALQASINPHFLFNVLDRIVGQATLVQNQPLIAMIRSLTDLLRYSMRAPSDLVTIDQELHYLKQYLFLQKQRYRDRFSANIEVPNSLLDIRIPKFSIQPVVENCFIHGVEQTMDPVHLDIRACREAADVLLSVQDDGPGMTAKRRHEVMLALTGESIPLRTQGNGVGLVNIHKRLQCLFGPDYGISVDRLPRGVKMEIRIPVPPDRNRQGN